MRRRPAPTKSTGWARLESFHRSCRFTRFIGVIGIAIQYLAKSEPLIFPPQQRRSNWACSIRAITIYAAYQHFAEASKGSIESGKLADLVILDRNPLAIPPDELLDLRVVATIKEGKRLYLNER